jgi:DNA-binding NarL/FixJ family response regulator
MESKVEHFLHAVREGAVGFVLREASASDITQVVSSVIAGQAICPSCFSATLFRWAAQRLEMHKNLQGRGNADFSRREEQVVKFVCWGLTNKEIAVRLHLSQYTVRNHVHRVLRKTGASDRISLIDRYVEQFPSDEATEEPLSRMIS